MADRQKGRGRVTDPANDGRLKRNRDDCGSRQQSQGDGRSSGDGRGQVRDPANDGRLKQNR